MQEVSNIQMRKLLTIFSFYANFYRGDQKEKNFCANPQQHQCGSRYQACNTTVPNGTRHAAECYDQQRLDSFQCLNRMDEYPSMFEQKVYKHKKQEESLSLNMHLDYNDTGVMCSEKDFNAWTDIENWIFFYCQSKHSKNRQIAGGTILELLFRDFGFEGRKHIPEKWLLEQ